MAPGEPSIDRIPIEFDLGGAHLGDLLMALPAIGAAARQPRVVVSGFPVGSAFPGTAVGSVANRSLQGMVGGVVSLHTFRQFGMEAGINYGAIAADAFGNALGESFVASVARGGGSLTGARMEGAAPELGRALDPDYRPDWLFGDSTTGKDWVGRPTGRFAYALASNGGSFGPGELADSVVFEATWRNAGYTSPLSAGGTDFFLAEDHAGLSNDVWESGRINVLPDPLDLAIYGAMSLEPVGIDEYVGRESDDGGNGAVRLGSGIEGTVRQMEAGMRARERYGPMPQMSYDDVQGRQLNEANWRRIEAMQRSPVAAIYATTAMEAGADANAQNRAAGVGEAAGDLAMAMAPIGIRGRGGRGPRTTLLDAAPAAIGRPVTGSTSAAPVAGPRQGP